MKYKIDLLLSCSHIISEYIGKSKLEAMIYSNSIFLGSKRHCYICHKEGAISKIGSVQANKEDQEKESHS